MIPVEGLFSSQVENFYPSLSPDCPSCHRREQNRMMEGKTLMSGSQRVENAGLAVGRKAPVRESQEMTVSFFSLRHPLGKGGSSWWAWLLHLAFGGLMLPSVNFPAVRRKEEFEEKMKGNGKVRHSPLVDSCHH